MTGEWRTIPYGSSVCLGVIESAGEPRIPGRDLDAAVGSLLVAVMTPETIALTLAIHDDLRAQAAEAERLRQ
jgi:hypothetical protein